MADGNLNFDTKLDTDGFEKGTGDLKDAAERLIKSIERLTDKITGAFDVSKPAETASKDVEKVSESMEEATEQASDFEEQWKKLQEMHPEWSAPDDSPAQDETSQNVEIPDDSPVVESASEDVSMLQNAVDLVDQTVSDIPNVMEEAGAAIEGALDEPCEDSRDDLNNVQTEVYNCKEALEELSQQGFTFGDKEFDEAYVKLNNAENALKEYKKSLTSTNAANAKVATTSKGAAKGIDKVAKSSKKAKGASVPLIKSIFKLSNMFKLMVARMAIKAVIEAVKEGFQNLVKYSADVNDSASQIKSSMTQLKSSFATAFAPILTVVTPALTTFIDALSAAISKVGQFFSVLLTGKTVFTQAKKVQEDYAGSLSDSANAAKKSTASFDKLNTLSDNSSSSSGEVNPKDMFEEVEVDSEIQTLVGNIKGIFEQVPGIISGAFGPAFADVGTLVQPAINYFNTSFLPLLQTVFTTAGDIAGGLFTTISQVFSDIWNLVLFPIIQTWIETWLPMVTDFINQSTSAFGVLFDEVKKIFDMIWSDAIAPILDIIISIWCGFVDTIKEVWDTYGAVIFEGIKEAFKQTGTTLRTVWNKFLKPVWDKFMDTIKILWDKHLQPFIKKFGTFIAKIVDGALKIYNKFISPVVQWFVKTFGPPIAEVINTVIEVFGDFLGGIIDAAGHIMDALSGLIDFITNVFTGNWSGAWQGLVDAFGGVWNAIVDIVKAPINLIIGLVNGMLSAVGTGVNFVVRALNKLSFDVPGWVPLIGGSTFGFNVPEVSMPQIPYLAKGAVIPPNSEFLAMLGDQKHGTNIEAPLDTIVDAFRQVSGENKQDIVLKFTGSLSELARILKPALETEDKRIGVKLVTGGA